MSSTKVFLLFAALLAIFGLILIPLIQKPGYAELEKANDKIAILETQKRYAIQDAKLAEDAANAAIERAMVAAAETDKAKAELAKARSNAHPIIHDGIQYLPAVISDAQDAVILTLESELKETKIALTETKSALANTKKALQLSENQVIEAKLALEANKAAIKSATWKGRFEGFSVGIGTGLLASVIK